MTGRNKMLTLSYWFGKKEKKKWDISEIEARQFDKMGQKESKPDRLKTRMAARLGLTGRTKGNGDCQMYLRGRKIFCKVAGSKASQFCSRFFFCPCAIDSTGQAGH